MIVRGHSPCIPNNEIIEVAFQTTNRGYETDDTLVIAKSSIGQHRLLAQIKYNLTFSTKNEKFHEVITAFWKDFNNSSNFDKIKDRLLIIKSGLTKDERNHLKSVLNWAKTHATEVDFISEINRIKAKEDQLNIFRESLKEANDKKALTDKELWEFLKCLDVLEYDFTHEGSIDETYFLNLIKLSKNESIAANEKEIWNSILAYVSKLNKDGGSVTIESIQKEELYRYFDTKKLNPYFKAVEKLIADSKILLKAFKSTISGIYLERKYIYESIVRSINHSQFTIVTGRPGVGKSAAIKEILHGDFFSASVFVFRADQFNLPHLANVFSNQGVNEKIQDIFSCISLIPEKIVVIDSLEKLLEGDPENAFKQLLSSLKEFPDIKIVATARRYSIDLIYQKFGIEQNTLGIVEIATLDDRELATVIHKFPLLQNVLKHTKIKKLLVSPKYLDFAISALNRAGGDFTGITLRAFKENLWNILVKDSTNRIMGFPAKREDAFMHIAVNRAKEMKLFIKPTHVDEEAIDLLEKDEIIIQEDQKRRYSPSHDILEDWALVKYVTSKFEEHSAPKELFCNLGNEPAIRRAFRLWVEDEITEDVKKINVLIKSSLDDASIEKYWADELLIAIFKSDNCSSFFQAFEKELLKNDASLLMRCIHLIRTACKESNFRDNNFSLLLPSGSGWQETISFIKKHIEELSRIRHSICNLIFDWEYRLLFQAPIQEKETLEVKEITIYFIYQIEAGDKFWENEYLRRRIDHLISLLYNLSHVSQSEITQLIEKACKAKEDRSNWKLGYFYESVIDKCLLGLGTQRLTKELPQLVVQTAWREWKLKMQKKDLDFRSTLATNRGNRWQRDKCWGIKDNDSFSPSGIYRTPIYNLLYDHPVIGLKFLTEFINYSVEFYLNADCEYKYDITQIVIKLNNGKTVKQWAAWELWVAYRGLGDTHHAIESLLMSLEKYLLEIADRKTERSKKDLQFMFNYLLQNSNNVTISSVLTSVTIAYPEEVGDEMLPLLSVKEFYVWDSDRALKESFVSAPQDDKISFAQEERWKSNQLPHRKKYTCGLSDFIVSYQVNFRNLNTKIHQLFDKLKATAVHDDIFWRKLLTEIDIRNWEVTEFNKEVGRGMVQPKYEKDVNEFINSKQDYSQAQSISMYYATVLRNAYEQKEPISFDIWKNCFIHYSKLKNSYIHYDRPITLALIGLRDFDYNLNKKQKNWCIKTLKYFILTILQDAFSGDYGLNSNYNLMEKQIALSSFHFLFNSTDKPKEKNNLISLMIYMLIAPFAEHENDKIIQYVRTEFFKYHPILAKRVWAGLILYAKFKNTDSFFDDNYGPKLIGPAKNKAEKFIQKLSSTDDLSININEINLELYEGYLLTRAFAITPYNSKEQVFSDFIKHFILLFIEDLKLEKGHSYRRESKSRQINRDATLDAKVYIAELILYADISLIIKVIDLLYDSLLMQDAQGHQTQDLYEFVSSTLEYVVLKFFDYSTLNANGAEYDLLTRNFWNLWRHLAKRIKESNKDFLLSTLFFNIQFLLYNSKNEPNEKPWKAFERDDGLFYEMISIFGNYKISKYIIDLFSTVGEAFLPNGLSKLVEIMKIDDYDTTSLISPSAERLIKRIFYNHISTVKKNKNLINDYVWILDKMVDLGSSQAYLFRENVITYKSNNYAQA